jgi:hypothetical protein
MYEGWKIERWETPVSDVKSLAMVSLVDDGQLSIVLQETRDAIRRRFCLSFKNYPVYRNILEEYRLELWNEIKDQRKGIGWTIIIPESQWLASLLKSEPLLGECNPNLVHYVICTEDDVIEVLSNALPQITELDPAAEDEEVPGKSRVYFYPEDKDKIDKEKLKWKVY